MTSDSPSQTQIRDLYRQTLDQLSGVRILTKTGAGGTRSGIHQSSHRGSSIEFAEHREYSAGDDLRHIDWKAYGKFDRYYVRQYETEAELQAFLLVDCSASMGIGDQISKYAYATVIAAAASYVLASQRDQPGLIGYADRVLNYLPPSATMRQASRILETLSAQSSAGKTSLAAAVGKLLRSTRRKSLVILISDLFEDLRGVAGLLSRVKAHGHELVVIHVLDDDELDFSFKQPLYFESPEDEQRLLVDPQAVRRAYIERMSAFCRQIDDLCRDHRLRCLRTRTSKEPAQVLRDALGSLGG